MVVLARETQQTQIVVGKTCTAKYAHDRFQTLGGYRRMFSDAEHDPDQSPRAERHDDALADVLIVHARREVVERFRDGNIETDVDDFHRALRAQTKYLCGSFHIDSQ